MERAIDVAAYIAQKYREITGDKIDEMKLHKLLYLTQREAFAILDSPIISDPFEGWQHGPVCVCVREAFFDGDVLVATREIPQEIQYIVDNVLHEYGHLASWKLREISHQDSSWIKSRYGLKPDQPGHVILSNEDIKNDASKIRPYDHLWDMYYDEFEDEEEEVSLG